jgi:predicted GIY-YIG superfamily endonuclease
MVAITLARRLTSKHVLNSTFEGIPIPLNDWGPISGFLLPENFQHYQSPAAMSDFSKPRKIPGWLCCIFKMGRAAPKAFGVGHRFKSCRCYPPLVMAWVYILRGSNGRHYIGSTVDFEARFEQHLRGHTYTTQRLGTNIRVLASREFPTMPEARSFERFLKAKKNPKLALLHLQSG